MEELKNFNINTVLNRLKKRRVLFHCEVDFQFELALVIKELYNVDIRLEYYIGNDGKNREYLDILVIDKKTNEKDRQGIAIELKYKTRKEDSDYIKVNNELFNLKEQSAYNDNRYYIYKDISRIQKIVEKQKLDTEENWIIKKGFVIFLTTDSYYGYKYIDLIDSKDLVNNFNLGIKINNVNSIFRKNEKEKMFSEFIEKNSDNEVKRKVFIQKGNRRYKNKEIEIDESCYGIWNKYSEYKEDEKENKEYLYKIVFEITI